MSASTECGVRNFHLN